MDDHTAHLAERLTSFDTVQSLLAKPTTIETWQQLHAAGTIDDPAFAMGITVPTYRHTPEDGDVVVVVYCAEQLAETLLAHFPPDGTPSFDDAIDLVEIVVFTHGELIRHHHDLDRENAVHAMLAETHPHLIETWYQLYRTRLPSTH